MGKMKFTFGALKEIKSKTGVDLFNRQDGDAVLSNDRIPQIAAIACKWGAADPHSVSDDQAQRMGDCVTINEFMAALRESTGANVSEDPEAQAGA